MASSGQTRHAPNSRKQATSSSAAFIGSEDYSSIARGRDRPSEPPRTLAGRAEDAAGDEVLEAFLELGGDLPGDRLGVARALGLGARGPPPQGRGRLPRPLPPGHGGDHGLEWLGE